MNRTEPLELIDNNENFGVEFKRNDVRPEQLAKEVVAILDTCGENPSGTIPELVRLFGVTERSFQQDMQKLRHAWLLRCVGGRKEGHWEATHDSD